MGKMIEQMSGGRLIITPYSSGGIVPAYEELDAAASGALDASCGGFSEHRNRMGPVVDLFTQYAGGLTAPEFHSWYFEGDQEGIKFVRELYKDLNVHFVSPSTSAGAENEMWSNRKLQSAADYRGLKIRTYGDWGKILVNFGASVVTMAGSELYPAMERGVIDALEYSTPAIDRSMAFWEVADYLHYPGIHSPGVLGGAFFVNQQKWNELPDDLKHIVEVACEYTTRKGYATDKYNSGEALAFYQAQGVELVRLPDDLMIQIVKACDEMWTEYADDDPFFKTVWESQKAFQGRWASSLMVEPDVQRIRAMVS